MRSFEQGALREILGDDVCELVTHPMINYLKGKSA